MNIRPFLTIPVVSLIAACAAGCAGSGGAPKKSYFVDVHEFGPGKVTAADVAKAHQADLAAQAKHDVRFLQYWVDEARGTVYCLSEANDAPSVVATHQEAHGLLPTQIMPVSAGTAAAEHKGAELFLDVHEFGPGKVRAVDVAKAHQADLAVEAKRGVRFLNYWVDEANGKVFCLSEAPNADAVRETHREAHGLLPSSVTPVKKGE